MLKKLGGRTLVWLLTGAFVAVAPAAASGATFFPNRFDDPAPGAVASTCNNASNTDTSSECSLREAVIKADAAGGTDTIQLAAGTYQLTRVDPEPDANRFNSQLGALDIKFSGTITGAGMGTGPSDTIVQAGTNATNGVDVIFIVNPYASISEAKVLNTTISNMTLRFGKNADKVQSNWGNGGAVEFDSTDGGVLTLDHDLITQNSVPNGLGGGVASFNTSRTSGTFSSNASRTNITNSEITDNSADTELNAKGEGTAVIGGGIFVGTPEPITIQNSVISGNQADIPGHGSAGGIEVSGPSLSNFVANVPASTIQNSQISNNTASVQAGGLLTTAPLTITNTTFANNTATSGEANTGGGAILSDNDTGGQVAISGSTFTGNSVTGNSTGGAILNDAGNLSVTDSRVAGNSAPRGSGIDQKSNTVAAVTSATDDWWGCNGGPDTGTPPTNKPAPGCDSATDENTITGSGFTISPWVTLKTTANPSTLNEFESSSFTTSFLQDSANNTLSTAQIAPLIGLPVTWTGSHGSFSNTQTTIQSNGEATATFTQNGQCATSSGEATVDHVQPEDSTATASLIVHCPDLQLQSTDNVGGTTVFPSGWTWTLNASNTGAGPARFTSGQRLLVDDLPNSGASYGAVIVTPSAGVTGAVACSIASSTLTCTASGGSVVIPAGASLSVAFSVTPSARGTFANPRASGKCEIDPDNVVSESNEANNTCSDTVVVTEPDLTASLSDNVSGQVSVGGSWNWKAHVANIGNGDATFANGATILTDDLPSGELAYGAVSVGASSGIGGTGTPSCSIASNVLTCTASGGTVVIGKTAGAFDVTVPVTPSTTGTFTNPPAGATCTVDPAKTVADSNPANNVCNSDTVTVGAPNLSAVKTDDVSGTTTLGNSWTWKIAVTNTGIGDATFASGQTILTDNLPNSNIAYGSASVSSQNSLSGAGSVSCSIVADNLTCTASGGPVTIGKTTGGFDVSFTATPSNAGIFANPRAGGVCAVDPGGVIIEAPGANTSCSDTVVVPANPSVQISTPPNGATYSQGQAVVASYSCTEGAGGPGIQTCSGPAPNGSAIDTSTLGEHEFTVTATSKDGLTAAATSHYTIVAEAAPTAAITSPADNEKFTLGEHVPTSFSCTDGAGAPGIATCIDSNGASGSTGALDTSKAGGFTYTVTATSKDGLSTTATIHYTVVKPENPSVQISTPPNGATYTQGQIVGASYSCTEGAGGPGIQTCSGPVPNGFAIDTLIVGEHEFTVTATSKDGLTASATHHYTVDAVGPPTATITTPRDNQTFTLGESVATLFNCADAAGAPGINTCADSNGATGKAGLLSTSKAGHFTYTVTATSKDGQSATATIHYTVVAMQTSPFAVSHIKVGRKGTVEFDVSVSGPGIIRVLEAASKLDAQKSRALARSARGPVLRPGPNEFVFARVTKIAASGRTYIFKVRPDAAGQRLVCNHQHPVLIRLLVAFTPHGGHLAKLEFPGLLVAK